MWRRVIVLAMLCSASQGTVADESRLLFNGKNLEAWVRVNTAESTWEVRDGMLICSGKPIGELRTTRMYQNFILEVEWRHMKPRGNAGIFVWADDITARGVPFHRSIEVQVLENAYGNSRGHTTHGDIFPIHGAKMTPLNGRGGSRAFPTENRSKPSPEWNHYRIECRDGEISLAVNGKVVTRGKECVPRKGYICIESEGGVVHYRNMRITELADTPIKKEHVAIADRGYRCMYDGIDLQQWDHEGDWKPRDWKLHHTGAAGVLTSKEEFGEVDVIFDVLLANDEATAEFTFRDASVRLPPVAARESWRAGWNRVEVEAQREQLTWKVNGQETASEQLRAQPGPLRFNVAGNADLANIYVRERDKNSSDR